MMQLRLYLLLAAIVSIFVMHADVRPQSYDSTSGEFYLMTKDGHESYTVNGSVVFRATAGSTIPSYKDNGVTFVPAQSGEVIVAQVEEVDLEGSNYLLAYQGEVATGEYGASDGVDQSTYLPAGWTNKIIKGTEGLTITSTATDGKLTFGYHSSGSASQKGFKITISSVVPKDMEYVSADAVALTSSLYRGAKNQALIGVNVKTEGINKALTLDNLEFDLSTLTAQQVVNARIYAGNKFTSENLIASTGSAGGKISITATTTLKSGNNHYYVVGDLLPDFVGQLPTLTLTKVSVSGSEKTIQQATTPAVAVTNTILMPAEKTSYNISEAANFYDDGGITGKISSNFEGSVTFIPATADHKIKIDFSKLEIFNTSSVGLNDVFNFYNGTEATETNLIATLLKDKKIVKSTSPDGAMTVTLKSTTGIPAEGWEATVSQFLPGNMTIESVASEVSSTEELSPASTDSQFLIVNVRASNILLPLSVTSLNVGLENTPASLLDKVKVYLLGEEKTFSTANLFGETTVEGTAATITGTAELKEGNNYFAIVADISATATKGLTISLSATSVNIGEQTKTIEPKTVATRSVNTVFKHQQGTKTVSIYEPWTFTDTKSRFNSDKYNYEDADCIVTFRPAESNAQAEIEFSSFDVYYASSSYGVKAVYEIYSGSEVNADNLLWKLSDNAQSQTGPGKKLRSAAADGSITIKFNANTSSSYYAGKGWNATITPFVNHNMTVDAISVSQASTANLVPGSKNQEIIDFSIATSGNLTSQVVKEIAVGVKNSAKAIEKVTVLYAGASTTFDQATIFGTADYTTGESIGITGEQTLNEGTSNFRVLYDIKATAESDIEVDASILSIKTTDAEAYTPQNGDPEGVRLTKNILNLQQGENGTIILNNPVLFYDDGGADNNYSSSFDGQVTFVPAKANEIVKITNKSFKTNSAHYMYLYNGREANEDNLIAKYSSEKLPAEVLSKAADGSLTVRFISTSTGTRYAGWELKVESYEPQSLSVATIETSHEGSETILRGAVDEPLLKIAVTVAGDKGSITLNNFKGSLAGTSAISDIKDVKLWYTGTSTSFISTDKIAESTPTEEYNFTAAENLAITSSGTYYFWVTASVSAEATAENHIKSSLNTIDVDAKSQNTTALSPADKTVKAGFKGEYTIGSSENANYKTIAEAVVALAGGVEGAVTFKLETGSYAENILISKIAGTSATHPIIFTSQSGNKSDVKITGAGYSEPAYGEQKYGMVAIDNTHYVKFENMSFIPESQSYPYCVHILNSSRHFTLNNCEITAALITSGYSGMNLVYMQAINEEGKNNDFISIENNTLTGGYIALYTGGTSYVALSKEVGAKIINNTVINAASKGIYVNDELDALVYGNTVTSATTEKTSYSGIDIYRCKGNLVVCNNKIVNRHNVYSTGINIRSEAQGTVDTPILIYNNAVSLTAAPNTSASGIEITSDCANISLVNNTINVEGEGGYGLNFSKTYTNLRGITVKNNLIQSTTPSALINIQNAALLGGFTFESNGYYTTATKFSNNGGDTFDDWKVKMSDAASIQEKADFISSFDLHLKSLGGLGIGVPVDYILVDADGVKRNAEHPTLGAYEYEVLVIERPEIAESYPVTGNVTWNAIDVKTKWSQSGKLHSIIKKATEEAPTVEALLATTDIKEISKNEEVINKFESLEETTAYKAYFLLEGALGENSAVIATSEITTLKYYAPLAIAIDNNAPVKTNTEVTLTPVISGGEAPYTCEWINRMNEIVSSSESYTFTTELSEEFTLNVTSNDGQKAVAYIKVPVTGKKTMATFEDNYLAPESYWNGGKSTDPDEYSFTFFSGSYEFTNTYMPAYQFFGGFAYSNITATEFDAAQMMTHQFRSTVGHGASNSATFALAYTMGAETKITVLGSEEGETVSGAYFTNTAYALSSILNGDSFNPNPFRTGDFLKLVFKGDDATGQEVEFYLADYRNEDATKHYALTDWKWCDLSPLGTVKTIKVELQASNVYVPVYFCMDNFGGGSTDVELNEFDNIAIYPIPAENELNIKGVDSKYSTRVIGIDGTEYLRNYDLEGQTKVDVSVLSAGAYLIEIAQPNGNKTTKRFLKK
ncbi:MAG: DUF4465 domain-containing protein [Muribaculaceae bacterium]|nr:DUF4465 domain-containing protein [Muribaculaceae bacterium]